MKYFPDNTTTKFITKLPRVLCPVGEWSVSLAEIDYPLNLLHVPSMDNTITFARADFTKGSDDVEYHAEETVYVPSGIYQSIDALLETINKLDRLSEHLQFKSTSNGYVTVSRVCEDSVYQDLIMSSAIARILGFDFASGVKVLQPHETFTSVRPASLTSAIPNTMFIYTDICGASISGDVQTPILRAVPIDSRNLHYGTTKLKTFSPSRYIALIRNNIHTIEIDITDGFGKPIPFVEGTLTVTLHFKRIT